MSLDKNALKAAFVSLLTFDPAHSDRYTIEYMAQGWADAYDSYASGAQDALGNTVTVVGKELFKTALIAAFGNVDPNLTMTAVTNAINVYWAGVVLSVFSIPPGGITPIVNIVNATPGVLTFPTDNITSTDLGAQRIADSIDAKTKQVTTMFTYIHAGSPPYPDVYMSSLR